MPGQGFEQVALLFRLAPLYVRGRIEGTDDSGARRKIQVQHGENLLTGFLLSERI